MNLENTVGKTIADFCGCSFTDPAANHCAHFVCHHLQLSFDMTCKRLTGKGTLGANVRVHEIFAQCPRVGLLSDWNGTGLVLAFVTKKTNVNLATKTMANVPQKHIGIYDGQHIYHYGNTRDKVVKQTVAQFKQTFQSVYQGPLGFYFGAIPGTLAAPRSMARNLAAVTYEIRDKEVYARINGGKEFYVARRVAYGSRVGLAQTTKLTGPVFNPEPFAKDYGPWPYVIYAIGVSESGNRFNRLNSYDRAAFTFGFFQLAAHTPNDNLVLFLRRATELPDFQALFPELKMKNDRLHRISGNVATDLEQTTYNPKQNEYQLQHLMSYLNPDDTHVDDVEIGHAAKMISLCETSPAFCAAQVETAIQITTRKFRERYHPWYDLTGALDSVCVAIADIHHQGRGKKAEVKAALRSNKPLAALTQIGMDKYPERCKSLRATITALEKNGKLGRHRYEPAHGLLVPV